ncbi:MAG: Crp/Fnr family transcriptional regulator [Bacteroidota bacterium]
MFKNISECPIFKGINAEELSHILNTVNYQVRTFSARQLIASNGDECKNLLILIEGSVKGEMIDYTGKIIKIEDIEAPKPLAPAFLFGKNNKYPVDIVANNHVKPLFIPKESFIKLLQTNKIILNNYLNVISNRSQFLSDKIKFLSFRTIKGKIAHFILQLAKTGEDVVNISKTQQELADFFGVTRPSLARSIGEMEAEGLIEAKRNEIKIKDKKKLFQLVQ